jgi:hypothetical protein
MKDRARAARLVYRADVANQDAEESASQDLHGHLSFMALLV